MSLASLETQNSQIANFELIQAGAQVCTIAVLDKPILCVPSACLLQALAGAHILPACEQPLCMFWV